MEYAPLVKVVAGRLSMYLGKNVEFDDLVSYGIFGLIDAIDKYDLDKDVKFETYASLRIRGSILDQIRKMDWIPRTVRQKQKRIDEAVKTVEMRTGKNATDEEVARELGVSEDELLDWQSQLKITNVISLNEYVEQGSEPVMDAYSNSHFIQPEDMLAQEELKVMLEEALQLLTEKERKVILMYYYEELTLKEISLVLEVSESRVSQLHTKAIIKMRQRMGDYLGILTSTT
jgi:RNA polymerase sigma factor for flagellar operon FliA